jgi:4-phytase/acid phosphatase
VTKIPHYFFAAIAVVLWPHPSAAQTKQAQGEKLKFALVLTRHGVRSPTWTNARLDEFSKNSWPKWAVAPGLLTPHGKTLMTQFGAYYRLSFSELGLLSTEGCAEASHIYFRADTDERTVETGRGLADGMLAGCKVDVHSLGENVNDPLFHFDVKPDPYKSGLAYSAVAGRIGSDPAALLPAYQLPLELMQEVLSGCAQANCVSADQKQLLDVKPKLARGTDDHLVEIKGPLSTGATFAEDFQLEYLEGMPAAQVGWGRIHEETMRSLMTIHAASSDLMLRTPFIAQQQASNLLMHMLKTLEQAQRQKPVAGAIGDPDDKVVFLIGHDTNISTLAGMLNAHWLVNGYQRDDAAPGGALVFELWERPGMEDAVSVYYTVQTPQQMRNSQPLTLANPPGKAVIFLPGCSEADSRASCKWGRFEHLVQSLVDPTSVQ